MSTRSYIAKELEDGSVRYIYCHFDGYVEHNGRILVDHYSDSDKVNQLLDLGDLSYLSEEIGEKQDFNQPTSRTWCLAYGRDRGEHGVGAKITPIGVLTLDRNAASAMSRSHFIKVLGDNVDYVYLFRDHCDDEVQIGRAHV